MIIQDVIDNLVTDLKALTWQPVGNTGVTSFVGGVYSAPHIDGTNGSPWAFIIDTTSNQVGKASRGINGDTSYRMEYQIQINLCITRGNTDNEENYRRLRYATEAVENYIKGEANLFNAGFTQGWNYTGWNRFNIDDTNIEGRQLNLINLFTI